MLRRPAGYATDATVLALIADERAELATTDEEDRDRDPPGPDAAAPLIELRAEGLSALVTTGGSSRRSRRFEAAVPAARSAARACCEIDVYDRLEASFLRGAAERVERLIRTPAGA